MQDAEADTEAVARVRAGDPEAFRVLMERHAGAVHRLAMRMTGNEQDA
jgi:RNA polymerase sigma-70 factor, ECF subfamily